MIDLNKAWNWREKRGYFEKTQALRVFHGPGESHSFTHYAIDRFGDHYWITQWEEGRSSGKSGQGSQHSDSEVQTRFVEFYRRKGARSVVLMSRPKGGVLPSEPLVLWGHPPDEKFDVKEFNNSFKIQFSKTRHPGLFLDHLPLRNWLEGASQDLRVLNTFAYTGSLSVAAKRGGASHVTTLDLSKPSIQWAQENMILNGFENDSNRWISGDVFEWLPRLKKEGERFDCVILDPPSFSRGKKAQFSTQKDLTALHGLAMDLLTEHGYLVTSINSANVSWKKYETDLLAAAHAKKMKFSVLSQMDLPETFPTSFGNLSDRYLKGWILRRT